MHLLKAYLQLFQVLTSTKDNPAFGTIEIESHRKVALLLEKISVIPSGSVAGLSPKLMKCGQSLQVSPGPPSKEGY